MLFSCVLFVYRSDLVANDLFLSSDSEAESSVPAPVPKPAPEEKKLKRKSTKAIEGASKKPKTKISPISPPARLTAQDLFGNDSEEEVNPAPSSSKTGKPLPPLYSYFTKRESKGYTRRINETLRGKYYVELKIYDAEEIRKIQPINRWRYAITTVKTSLDDDKEAWRHIKGFVRESQKGFLNCPTTLLGLYEG